MPELTLGGIDIEVIQKDIKNVHLSVHPPEGRVRVSTPKHIDQDTLRAYIIAKLPWIRKQQQKLQLQEREAPRDMVGGESHYYNGQRYLLEIVEREAPPEVDLGHHTITLYVRSATDPDKRLAVLREWYRARLKERLPALIQRYEKLMNVQVAEFGVKQMKTRWGTCNPAAGRIWVNLELAKKPASCLEYIVVHEMVHLLEPSHNERFKQLMTQYMPNWRSYRDDLNSLPVRYEDWGY